jgi:beta-lactamase regulating signal transducer with metallopeptidase domain
MWVFGSGSLANVASFTPGSIGVTQANVTHSQAVHYSTAQQLITTAWNQLLAILLVCWVFGWTGGKQLISASYADAKARSAEMKAERQRKNDERKAGAPMKRQASVAG